MVIDKVKEILAEKFHVDAGEINDGTDLQADLGADSLDAVELMMTLEDELNIRIPDEDARCFKTVGDIINYLKQTIK